MGDIVQIEQKVENSVKVIETESKEFERLEQKHQDCGEMLSKMEPKEIVEAVAQSRQIT